MILMIYELKRDIYTPTATTSIYILKEIGIRASKNRVKRVNQIIGGWL